ncbi:MAG: hypothetical protein ACO1OB_03310 [Archangium sp.]
MLLNVRLTEDEEKIVRNLRRAKVNVSALVRRAIRQEGARAEPKNRKRSESLNEALQKFPTPGGFRPAHPDLSDRKALADFMRKKATKK